MEQHGSETAGIESFHEARDARVLPRKEQHHALSLLVQQTDGPHGDRLHVGHEGESLPRDGHHQGMDPKLRERRTVRGMVPVSASTRAS